MQRFQAEWEKAASLGLRLGKEEAIVAYEAHGRVIGGEREALLDAALPGLEGRHRPRARRAS